MRQAFALLLLTSILLTGCSSHFSEAPVAGNFLTKKQMKLQSASHWQIVAQDLAEKVRHDYQGNTPVYLEPSADDHPFSRAFHEYLTTALVQQGFTVLKEPADQFYLMTTHLQVVRFQPQRGQPSGFWHSLASGLWAVDKAKAKLDQQYNEAENRFPQPPVYSPLYYVDEFNHRHTPSHELIITLSLGNVEQHALRRSETYFIADQDLPLYESPKGKNIRVVGGL